jgi:hypothetical protein
MLFSMTFAEYVEQVKSLCVAKNLNPDDISLAWLDDAFEGEIEPAELVADLESIQNG